MAETATTGTPFVDVLVGFARALREAGVPVGSGDVLTYTAAMDPLDPTDLVDLYWAGRTTLVTRRDQLPVYDRVFRRWYLGEGTDGPPPLRFTAEAHAEVLTTLEVPTDRSGPEGGDEEEARLGLAGSDIEVLRQKSFADCTPEELATLRRIMAEVRLTPPRRRTRRTTRADRGSRPDLRRTVREALRAHGEPPELFWRRRRRRTRPLVLVLDVSGSMSDYSRNLLQFAHTARRADARVEVFCFGTRLTRITKALDRRRVDDALSRAATTVFDWEGGTRIGESLDAFVRGWGRSGLGRGGIVVICSDGLDRGDPALLAAAMERLARLAHRVVWMNPHKGDDPAFRPTTLGMMVAAPHVDAIESGHDLASLERFASRLAALG